jgi:hypothetical protein
VLSQRTCKNAAVFVHLTACNISRITERLSWNLVLEGYYIYWRIPVLVKIGYFTWRATRVSVGISNVTHSEKYEMWGSHGGQDDVVVVVVVVVVLGCVQDYTVSQLVTPEADWCDQMSRRSLLALFAYFITACQKLAFTNKKLRGNNRKNAPELLRCAHIS